MSKYIKVDDLQKYCDNHKDHAITPNDFQRMNFIELPDKYGRLIVADALLEKLEKIVLPDDLTYTIAHGILKRLIEDAETIVETTE